MFGPITLQERIDFAAAVISHRAHATAGGKLPLDRFLLKWSHPLQDDDQIVAVLKGLEKRYSKGVP